MSSELLQVLEYIEREKGISRQTIIAAVESSLLTASKKSLGTGHDLSVTIDPKTADIKVYANLRVVESDADEMEEIDLAEAREQDPSVQIGDVMQMEVTPEDFGRIAAQTARQVIIQKLREAEKDIILGEFADKLGTLTTGIVRRYSHGSLIVEIGRAEAIVPIKEQVHGERYPIGSRISAVIVDVREGARGPEIILSRTTSKLIVKLFELEIPEIAEGTVVIKSIAREPGHRTKVAVVSTDDRIDPVGACVGMRGSRVKNIVRELSGEKIDIIRWNPEVRRYIEEALSPAHVKDMEIDEQNKRVRVIVHDDQLSLAIGKRGQNARLTSKLTGWHVDIVSVEQLAEEKASFISEEVIEIYEEVEAGGEGEGDDVEYETVTVYEEVADEASGDEGSPEPAPAEETADRTEAPKPPAPEGQPTDEKEPTVE
ncbi:MAG: transcription termination/antitermination protein NusA [Verrucomicrobia bacterium]|nr:transcription termination/antitermination protein NusA [Verrucomicrobiota bacterium]